MRLVIYGKYKPTIFTSYNDIEMDKNIFLQGFHKHIEAMITSSWTNHIIPQAFKSMVKTLEYIFDKL